MTWELVGTPPKNLKVTTKDSNFGLWSFLKLGSMSPAPIYSPVVYTLAIVQI